MALLIGAGPSAATPPPRLACTLTWRATDPAALRLHLRNPGPAPLWVLTWGTPFEGWLQPYLSVRRDGVELPYRGASVKRGDPEADEYLRLPAGRGRSARIDLAAAFDLAAPGQYQVQPRLTLHDVHPAAPGASAARPRDAHQPLVPDCPPVSFRR